MRTEDLIELKNIITAVKEKDFKSFLLVGNDQYDSQRFAIGSVNTSGLITIEQSSIDFNKSYFDSKMKKYDCVIAMNTLIGAKDPRKWIEYALSASDNLIVQGLIYGKRGENQEIDPLSGDHMRFTFNEKKAEFKDAFSLENCELVTVSNLQFYEVGNAKSFICLLTKKEQPQKAEKKWKTTKTNSSS